MKSVNILYKVLKDIFDIFIHKLVEVSGHSIKG
jgi:hypothetical protein